MSTKSTPKSCSCWNCKRGKHSKSGHYMMKADERAYRRKTKLELKKKGEDADVAPAPIGNYYD